MFHAAKWTEIIWEATGWFIVVYCSYAQLEQGYKNQILEAEV